MKFRYPPGATPLEPEELKDLLPQHISTQEQLNAWEQQNILLAEEWALKSRNKDIVSIDFIRELHRKMFDQTWRWAGKFRLTAKNIGIDWYQIPIELKKLCDDVQYQMTHQTFQLDEIAVRFHHRLVWIHAFPNGNGRHARLIADVLLTKNGSPRFTWGKNQDLQKATPIRTQYIQALRLADGGNYSHLLTFVRS